MRARDLVLSLILVAGACGPPGMGSMDLGSPGNVRLILGTVPGVVVSSDGGALDGSAPGSGDGGAADAGLLDAGALGAGLDGGGSYAGFVPFVDGQDVQLVPGAQGGFHVWIKFRVRADQAGVLHMNRNADRVSDGKAVLRTSNTIDVDPLDAQGWWESPTPMPMFMCPSPIGVNIIGQAIRFDVSLLDAAGGKLAEERVSVVPHCPPVGDPQHDFCVRICSG